MKIKKVAQKRFKSFLFLLLQNKTDVFDFIIKNRHV